MIIAICGVFIPAPPPEEKSCLNIPLNNTAILITETKKTVSNLDDNLVMYSIF